MSGLTAANTTVTGKTICRMAKVNSLGTTGESTLESMLTMSERDMVFSRGQTEENTKVAGLKVSNMVKQHTKRPMSKLGVRESGRMANESIHLH